MRKVLLHSGVLIMLLAATQSTLSAQSIRPRGDAAYLEVAGAGGLTVVRARSLLGGEPVAELMQGGDLGPGDMRPGPVRYAEILAEAVPGDAAGLLRGWMDGTRLTVDGRYVILGADGRPLMERGFEQTRIIEVSLPALEARSADAIAVQLRMAPERTFPMSGKGGGPAAGTMLRDAIAFSLQLDGLDAREVMAIAPFGLVRRPAPGSGGPVGSRLTVTLTPAGATQLTSWHEDFVVRGRNEPGMERSLALRLIGRDGLPVLTLGGTGVGILAVRRMPAGGYGPTFQADLYVEQWQVQ
jgi:hypothetical protein